MNRRFKIILKTLFVIAILFTTFLLSNLFAQLYNFEENINIFVIKDSCFLLQGFVWTIGLYVIIFATYRLFIDTIKWIIK